jgi:hypothetical protein
MTTVDRQKQVDDNLESFLKELPNLAAERGKFALLRNGAIAGFFNTAMDAVRAGNTAFADQLFSIQQVTDVPIDLGFYSHAGSLGKS